MPADLPLPGAHLHPVVVVAIQFTTAAGTISITAAAVTIVGSGGWL